MSAYAPTPMSHQRQQRSWFWPIMLIAVGTLWLLRNLNVLTGANIAVLFRLWPLLLIAAGLNVLLARRDPRVGLWIGLGTVVVAVALMLIAPALGISQLVIKTEQFAEPIGDASTAQVTISLGAGRTVVQALNDSDQLMTADITHVGEVEYSASGTTAKTVQLTQNDTSTNFFVTDWTTDWDVLRWNVSLTPMLPLSLTINGGVGDSTFDLSKLQVKSLDFRSGVGDTRLLLPSLETSYAVTVNGGVGDTRIEIAAESALNLQITGGVGSFEIIVPPDLAVRLEAQSDMGRVTVPTSYVRISGDGDRVGLWETPNFDGAVRKLYISYKGGLGGLTVR